ncbi:MAG TPA: tRNA 2-thiocytidine biosynthesis TtcA family protein [Bacillota bacterium]|nr:tRNA 2-thiocytidine biosynthesis TtcA family protein [Bacillota bacterium]
MNHETAAEGGLYLPKGYHNKLIKAVMQFGLIEDGDNVLVGFSGGKDSAFLMYALKSLQLYSPLSFSLGSATVDLGFDESLDEDAVTEYARRLAMPHGFIRTKAFEVIKQRSEASPCAWCSYFRRASINTYARKNGYNKVAYAHHMDDAMETLMMNMLYSGRGGTFLPRTELTRSGITVIRPLIYFSEREVTKALKFMGFTPLESPCPYSGDTSRARVKKLIKELDMENRMVRRNIEAVVKAWLEPRIVSPGPENC